MKNIKTYKKITKKYYNNIIKKYNELIKNNSDYVFELKSELPINDLIKMKNKFPLKTLKYYRNIIDFNILSKYGFIDDEIFNEFFDKLNTMYLHRWNVSSDLLLHKFINFKHENKLDIYDVVRYVEINIDKITNMEDYITLYGKDTFNEYLLHIFLKKHSMMTKINKYLYDNIREINDKNILKIIINCDLVFDHIRYEAFRKYNI